MTTETRMTETVATERLSQGRAFYHRQVFRRQMILAALVLALLFSLCVDLALGPARYSLSEVVAALLSPDSVSQQARVGKTRFISGWGRPAGAAS